MAASTSAPAPLVRPFTVAVPDSEIDDLKERLARTRWPDPETVPAWSQGVRLEHVRSLVRYWEREYDWRRFETELNGLPQFVTEIDGLDVLRIAAAWVELVRRLGYETWAAQGGDWGSAVTTTLGAMQPDGLLGIHLNSQYAFPAQIPDTLSPEEQNAVDTLALYNGDMGGPNHLQATKPETIGIALADSPAGQAAWIYDKLQSKTDNNGLAEDVLTTDEILDAISLYWFTNSAASSARIYWENRGGTMAGPTLKLPIAVTVFPRDIPLLPRSWIEATYTNVIHYAEADPGGHFAAFEQPEIMVSEIRTGLRSLRA